MLKYTFYFIRVTELLTHAENHNPDLASGHELDLSSGQDPDDYLEPEYSPSLQVHVSQYAIGKQLL